MKDLIILTAAGTACDVVEIVNDINNVAKKYRIVGFLDDNKEGEKILGKLADAKKFKGVYYVDAFGSPKNYHVKKKLINSLDIPNELYETIIHPSSFISSSAQIGKGCIIYPHVTIMSNVKIGDHVIIMPHSVINHNVVIKDFAVITSGVMISGNVTIEENAYLGTGSLINNDIVIGKNAFVAMGAVVTKSVQENAVVAGIPARVIKWLNI